MRCIDIFTPNSVYTKTEWFMTSEVEKYIRFVAWVNASVFRDCRPSLTHHKRVE